MKRKLVSAGIFSLVLSGCVVVSPNYDGSGNWPPEDFRSECADQARTLGLKGIEVEPVRPAGRGEWEAMIRATDQAGREAQLRCSYDERLPSRRVTVDRLDR